MLSDLRLFLEESRVGSVSIRFGMSLSARGWRERVAAMVTFLIIIILLLLLLLFVPLLLLFILFQSFVLGYRF